MRRILLPAALLLFVATVAACDDDETTAPQPPRFAAELRGSNEVPTPVNTAATGRADVTLDGNSLTYTVTVSGLSSAPRGAHIHAGGSTVAGPIVYDFFPAGGPNTLPTFTSGTLVTTRTINLSTAIAPELRISVDSLKKLITTGNAYVNVHTANFPGGEIRGQLTTQ